MKTLNGDMKSGPESASQPSHPQKKRQAHFEPVPILVYLSRHESFVSNSRQHQTLNYVSGSIVTDESRIPIYLIF